MMSGPIAIGLSKTRPDILNYPELFTISCSARRIRPFADSQSNVLQTSLPLFSNHSSGVKNIIQAADRIHQSMRLLKFRKSGT